MSSDPFLELVELLDRRHAHYRLIPHRAEGRTDAASRLRNHSLSAAAKSMVVRVRITKRQRRYVLAVVPGDHSVSFERLVRLYQGQSAAFATREVAERLTGCPSGSFMPFATHPELELIVDTTLLDEPELFFNAGRLDLSLALRTEDYLALVAPRVDRIASPVTDIPIPAALAG